MPAEDTSRTLELLFKVIEQAPKDDARLQNYLAALRAAIESDAKLATEAGKVLAEYEEAYAKLTAPANRLGVFLQWLEAKVESGEVCETAEAEQAKLVGDLAGKGKEKLALI